MAAILIVTNAPPEYLRDASLSISQDTGFSTAPLADWSFAAQQGSLAMSLLFGAFIAYCDFKIHIVGPGDGTTQLVLERNNPWWTGLIGVGRVKRRANDLMNAIMLQLSSQGISILDRREL